MSGKSSGGYHTRTKSDAYESCSRLLQSPDQGTSAASQVLVLNTTVDSGARSEILVQKSAGATLMRCLLDLAQSHVEEDEDEEEGAEEQVLHDNDSGLAVPLEDSFTKKRRTRMENLGVLFAIFDNIMDRGLFDKAYSSLAPINEEHSLVSASQLTLLKLLDAKLQQKHASVGKDDAQSLLDAFTKLATWAQSSMQDVINAGPDEAKPDARLVEVHVGLVLLCQCLIQLSMSIVSSSAPSPAQSILSLMRTQDFVGTLICESSASVLPLWSGPNDIFE